MSARVQSLVSALPIPVPFGLSQFCGELARRRGRPVYVVPVTTGPRTPNGAWVPAAMADYIYHEAGTSELHQAHIVLHEIGHMLLGHQASGPSAADLAGILAPGISPALAAIILGPAAGWGGEAEAACAEHQEAELFASLILARADGARPGAAAPLRWARQWRQLRDLWPLWAALRAAGPQAALPPGAAPHGDIAFGLCRRVTEIRDAALQLRPWQPPATNDAPLPAVGRDPEADGAAMAARAALRARIAGRPGRPDAVAGFLGRGEADLDGDAAWLARVSRAFAHLAA